MCFYSWLKPAFCFLINHAINGVVSKCCSFVALAMTCKFFYSKFKQALNNFILCFRKFRVPKRRLGKYLEIVDFCFKKNKYTDENRAKKFWKGK